MTKIVVPTLDALPEALHEFAQENEEGFAVDLVPRSALEEMRKLNHKLEKERSDLDAWRQDASMLLGDDLDAFRSKLAQLELTSQKVKDGALKADGEVAKEVETRVASMKADFQKQLSLTAHETATWRDRAESTKRDLDRTIVESAVAAAVLKGDTGALPGALIDIQRRAHAVFTVTDKGTVIAKDGDAIIYGMDGLHPMTPREWLNKLKQTAPFYFENAVYSNEARRDQLLGGLSQADFEKLSGVDQLRIARANAM